MGKLLCAGHARGEGVAKSQGHSSSIVRSSPKRYRPRRRIDALSPSKIISRSDVTFPKLRST